MTLAELSDLIDVVFYIGMSLVGACVGMFIMTLFCSVISDAITLVINCCSALKNAVCNLMEKDD